MTGAAPSVVLDPVREASDVVGLALEATVAKAIHRAQVCGCKDCLAHALETVAWVERLLGVPSDQD
jgi:hypothetical protein